jgi:peptide/nickel transport system substrate-binding protein
MVQEGEPGPGLTRRELVERAGAAGLLLALPAGAFAAAPGALAAPSANGTLRTQLDWGPTSTIDPQGPATASNDVMRNVNVFERLFQADHSGKKLIGVLARSIEPNKKADVWTIALRRGIEWQDGTPFTADDVVYSLRRIATTKAMEGNANLQMVRGAGIRKRGAYVVEIPLKYPYADFPHQLADRMILMIKNGTTEFKALNGTGPFKYVSHNDREIVLEKNDNYWQSGLPRVNSIIALNIPDPTAQLNALKSGQVDLVPLLSPSNAALARRDSNLKIVVSEAGSWSPIVMDTSRAPFNNKDVRLAMRLIADRPAIRLAAQAGLGALGNDLFGRLDPMYASDLPQRKQDLEQAKFLLKRAGAQGQTFTLQCGNVGQGAVEMCVAFSQQAKKAGVNIVPKVNPSDSYWSAQYMKTPFFISGFANRSLMQQYLQVLFPGAPYNETQWKDGRTNKLFAQAMRTVNTGKRRQLLHDVQEILWKEGGYLIWGFQANAAGARKSVNGLVSDANGPAMWYDWKTLSA